MNRTTPRGLLRYAREFAEAARIVSDSKGDPVFTPTYYLYGHSIELALKAFLRASDYDLKKLKKLGHGLSELLAEALRQELESAVELTEEEIAAVHAVNPYYRGKELEYICVGYKEYPKVTSLQKCADKLIENLESDCESATRRSENAQPHE